MYPARRRVEPPPGAFLPLGQPDQAHGLLILVDPKDLDESEAATPEPSDPEAAQLHERIRTFRYERAARFRCESLAGGSPAMRRAQAQAEVAAGSRASVLIVGPPGSGRQHLASAIHYAGNPEDLGPLVPLACSILDADLIRSTLAALATQGLSGGSHGGGTLLLNEVDALPLEVQYEVAQALTGRTFPLRIIATARRRLEDLVAQQAFREELASSLSTLVIELPPLAQRLGDLPMLLQWFVEEANARGDKQVGGFAPEAVDLLHTHSWPGNLDELAKVVREAHKSAEGAQIGLRDLPESIHQALRAAAYPRRQEEKIVLEEYLARIERELLRRAMRRAKGNKTKAANLLGLTRPRLYRRLVQLGLVTEGEKEGDSPPK